MKTHELAENIIICMRQTSLIRQCMELRLTRALKDISEDLDESQIMINSLRTEIHIQSILDANILNNFKVS